MVNRKFLMTACGAVILSLMVAPRAGAWGTMNRTTYLTFSGPVALPGVTLKAGTYIFELADPNASLDLVRVLSRDRSTVYLTAFTNTIVRPAGLGADRFVTLGETSRGVAPRITAWYPPDDLTGREFRYR